MEPTQLDLDSGGPKIATDPLESGIEPPAYQAFQEEFFTDEE
jgi:hypothetical protein